ncbi:MAG TPA: C45 family peptidase [Streptosporangiaceae bacterium]
MSVAAGAGAGEPPAAAIPFVRATGEPFEVGYRHGAALAGPIGAFIDDDLCRIGRVAPAPVTLESLRPLLAGYGDAIAAATPRLSQEIDGLAAGAGISRELAVLLQVRREVIGYQAVPARGDCSTYASLSAGPRGRPLLAQTVDLNGDLDDQIAVLDVGLVGSPRRCLLLSFGGLLGYLGVNSDGLAIGLNLVLGGQWGPGLPPYLAIRHLLDNASSVAEALDVLHGLPLASSRSLTLCDPSAVACVEILGGEVRLVGSAPAGPVAHTNHYLDPEFARRDELNVFARNSSLLRLKACDDWLTRLGDADADAGAGVEDHFARLALSPVCVADTGDIRRERTVAAVVLLPEAAELHVRPGDPSASSTQAFSLRPASVLSPADVWPAAGASPLTTKVAVP